MAGRERPVWDTGPCVGAWRSLVARAVRVGEVPGSNPGAPIAESPRFSGVFGVLGVVKVPMRFRLARGLAARAEARSPRSAQRKRLVKSFDGHVHGHDAADTLSPQCRVL